MTERSRRAGVFLVFDYIRAFAQDFVTLMSGIASVILTFIGLARAVPNAAIWTAAALCFLFASFRVWRREHLRAEALERGPFSVEQRQAAVETLARLSDLEKRLLRELLIRGQFTANQAGELLASWGPFPGQNPLAGLEHGTHFVRRDFQGVYTINEDQKKLLEKLLPKN